MIRNLQWRRCIRRLSYFDLYVALLSYKSCWCRSTKPCGRSVRHMRHLHLQVVALVIFRCMVVPGVSSNLAGGGGLCSGQRWHGGSWSRFTWKLDGKIIKMPKKKPCAFRSCRVAGIISRNASRADLQTGHMQHPSRCMLAGKISTVALQARQSHSRFQSLWSRHSRWHAGRTLRSQCRSKPRKHTGLRPTSPSRTPYPRASRAPTFHPCVTASTPPP